MKEHRVSVRRSARYVTLGEPGDAMRELWLALHGYAQLAEHFARSLRPLDNGSRLIVAPEALSRFYVSGTRGHVGASWMTSVEREREIDDYVEYLDAVVVDASKRATSPFRLVALGFSQGAATAARWTCRGSRAPDAIVLWGGSMPADIELSQDAHRLRNLHLVLGIDDEYRDDAVVITEHQRLHEAGVPFTFIEYDGTHRIDAKTLALVADDVSTLIGS